MTDPEPSSTTPEPSDTAPEPSGVSPEPYQSLYRRFRPQRFSEVLGQEFVSLALRNAVREDHVGHAYLFSGPRGTGKTSTARILAKALNCANPTDGEPCGVCTSCVEIAAGSSLDVHELDAASNNGVDAMRDLVARAALGTPGRWKVYIVDEVHMLSAAASNALLKTLEEPPSHVVFVLATTDPQKVLQTIRSRTQHFEFRLIGPEVLHQLLETVRDEAKLDLPEHAVEMAVRRGRGSARDALSVLDQVAAAGIVEPDTAYIGQLAEALATRDPQAAVVALAAAVSAGREPLLIAGELADHLRQGFLSVLAPELVTLDAEERDEVGELATRMGLPALVRAVEALGSVQVDMRESPDPRLHVEVCLLRLTRPEVDDSVPALVERVERLERALAAGPVVPTQPPSQAQTSGPVAAQDDRHGHTETPPAEAGSGLYEVPSAEGPALARRSLGAIRREAAARRGQAESTRATDNSAGSKGPQTEDSSPEPGAVSDLGRKQPSPGSGSPGSDEAGTDKAGTDKAGTDKAGTDEAGTYEPGAALPADTASPPAATSSPPAAATPPLAGAGAGPAIGPASFPTRDELVQAWGDGLLASLPQKARARFRVGRFLEVDDGVAVFALPNEAHRSYCEEVTLPVEEALSAKFGTPVKLRLITDPDEESGSPTRAGVAGGTSSRSGPLTSGDRLLPPDDDEPDLLDPQVLAAETELAGQALSPEERLKLTFPGAQEV